MVAAVQFKEYVASARVFDIIIDKFNYWKELYPVILLEVDKKTEVGFYYTIVPLSLTVSLRVEDNGKSLLNTQKVAQKKPEF